MKTTSTFLNHNTKLCLSRGNTRNKFYKLCVCAKVIVLWCIEWALWRTPSCKERASCTDGRTPRPQSFQVIHAHSLKPDNKLQSKDTLLIRSFNENCECFLLVFLIFSMAFSYILKPNKTYAFNVVLNNNIENTFKYDKSGSVVINDSAAFTSATF